MDASQITALRQKQNTVYQHRSQTVDASTQIWRNQIQSSKYIKGVATCTGLQNTNVPTEASSADAKGIAWYGGGGKQMNIMTGSSQQYPSVFRGAAGSAVNTYSSENILLQKAGRVYCSDLINDENAPYIITPSCYTTSTNGPTQDNQSPSVNNNANPYLPAFDTFYQFKNKLTTGPVPDQNLKHFVQVCDGCVMTPPSAPIRLAWPALITGADDNSYAIANDVAFDTYGRNPQHPLGNRTFMAGSFVGTINFFNGGTYDTSAAQLVPQYTLQEDLGTIDGFISAYDDTGLFLWATAIRSRGGVLSEAYSTAVDQTGVYICGYFTNTVEFYDGNTIAPLQPAGTGVATLTTATVGLFLAKWSLDGRFLWKTMVDNVNDNYNIGATQVNMFSTSQLALNGTQIYLANYFMGTATVYNANGTGQISLTTTSPTHQHGFLVQFNSSTGMVQWATQLNSSDGTASSNALGLACDADNVYVSGGFYKTMTYYNTRSSTGTFVAQGTLATQEGHNRSLYVAAYSTLGAFLWINQADSVVSFYVCDGVRLSVDRTGVYVLGMYSIGLNVYLNPYTGSYGTRTTLTNLGANPTALNLAVVKYNFNGTVAWLNKINGVYTSTNSATINVGASLAADGAGVYVTGTMDNAPLYIYHATPASDPPVSATVLQPINTTQPVDPNALPILDLFLTRMSAQTGAVSWATKAGRVNSTAGSYGLYTNSSKVTLAGFAVGPIDLYQAPALSQQPTQIAMTLTPLSTANYFSFAANYNIAGQLIQ